MKKIFLLAAIASTMVTFSCKDDASANNNAITEIVSTIEQKRMKFGDQLTIDFSKLEGVDNVRITVDGKEVPNGSTISKDVIGLGNHSIFIEFLKGTEVLNSREFTFMVLGNEAAATWTYEVVNTFPHDNKYFTQGFYYKDGYIYEGTGLRNETYLAKYKLGEAKAENEYKVVEDVFGEGITELNGVIYQLTWQDRVGFKYDQNFRQLEQFNLPGMVMEGWGITTVGDQLAISEGTQRIQFFDKDFNYKRTIQAVDSENIYLKLNELEYHNGLIYANVYESGTILAIEPETGQVKAKIDLSELKTKQTNPQADVLNGIAFKGDTMLVTGKKWDHIYEVKIKKPL